MKFITKNHSFYQSLLKFIKNLLLLMITDMAMYFDIMDMIKVRLAAS